MKILFVSSTFPDFPDCPGAKFAGEITGSLAELNHEVHVLTSARTDIRNTLGRLNIHKVMRNWGWLEAPTVLQLIAQVRPQVIHVIHPTKLASSSLKTFIQIFPEMIRTMGSLPVVTSLIGLEKTGWLERMKLRPMLHASRVVTVENQLTHDRFKKFTKIEILSGPIEEQANQLSRIYSRLA